MVGWGQTHHNYTLDCNKWEKLKAIVGWNQDDARTQIQNEVSWKRDCTTAILLTVELNSETDICQTTILHALTPSEMQPRCEAPIRTSGLETGLHKEFWVCAAQVRDTRYATGLWWQRWLTGSPRHFLLRPAESCSSHLQTLFDWGCEVARRHW